MNFVFWDCAKFHASDSSNAFFFMYHPFSQKLGITKGTFSLFPLFSDFRLGIQTCVSQIEFEFEYKIKMGNRSLCHVQNQNYREEGKLSIRMLCCFCVNICHANLMVNIGVQDNVTFPLQPVTFSDLISSVNQLNYQSNHQHHFCRNLFQFTQLPIRSFCMLN